MVQEEVILIQDYLFDHMLDQLSKHSLVDLNIKVNGDLNVDEHHTIEDTAIALGESFLSVLGNKIGIERYAFLFQWTIV